MRNVMNVKTFILHLKFNESNLDCYEYFAESDAVFKYYLSDIFRCEASLLVGLSVACMLVS